MCVCVCECVCIYECVCVCMSVWGGGKGAVSFMRACVRACVHSSVCAFNLVQLPMTEKGAG